MALRTIHINGFKSFANDTKIHFYHPVTAIVGPNGSGKSNVADAIRFALGEQSMKSLRGGKGEDLIFNGSHKVGRKNRAHVSLTFDNKDKIFDYDASEIELQRQVHRDGVNEYLVNSNKTRLKDKQELIATANIGPTGHHLITQGEADKFVTATDFERRQLIEDALGLNLYKLRRKEAEGKLSRTQEKLKEVNKLIWEIEPVVKALSTEVDRLESLKQKEKTLIKLYGEMFYLWRKHYSSEDLRLKDKLEYLHKTKSQLESSINELVAQTSEHEQLSQEEIDLGIKRGKQQKHLSELRSTHTEVSNQIGQIEGSLEEVTSRISAVQNKLARSNKPAVSVITVDVERVESLHDEVQNANSLQAAKQSEALFYQSCLGNNHQNSDETLLGHLQTELESLTVKQKELDKKLAEKNIRLKSVITDIDSAGENLTRIENELRQASSGRLTKVRELEQKRAKLQQTNNEIEQTKSSINNLITENTNTAEKKTAVARIYGSKILDTQPVMMAAGESLPERMRNTKREVLRLEAQLEDVDISALDGLRKDLDSEAARLTFLTAEKHDVETSYEKIQDMITDLTSQIETKIEVGLATVNTNLERFFRVLFGGGSCVLQSVKDGDKKGVTINLQLPYKRIKSVHALSGGERSLASLAILFAITLLSPPPFVVLDETDAALDEANSRRYAKLIRELAEHTQLILITHNRETMTFADELYGVTMGSDGVSRLLSVTLREAENSAKN